MRDVPYVIDAGSLMYAMLCTRLDICFAVVSINRYQSNPRPTHRQALKRIMYYLHGTTDLVLCDQGGNLELRGYSYANLSGEPDSLGLPYGMSSSLIGEPCHGAVRGKIA